MNFYERLNNDYPDCMKLHSYTKQNIKVHFFLGISYVTNTATKEDQLDETPCC
jgi:hypothetical protein